MSVIVNYPKKGGGGSGGVTIGAPVSGGTPNSILYIDAAGNLTEDPGFTRDPLTKQTRIVADIPAAIATDSNLPNPFGVVADVNGDQGNSIVLVANGVDDVDTIVANWNASPNIPGNTATVKAGGTSVPDAGSYTLKGGGISGVNIGEFAGGVIYGTVISTTDETNQINTIFGSGNLSGFTGSPWGQAFFVQDEANDFLTGYIQGVQSNSIVAIDLASFSYFSSIEASAASAFIKYVDNTTNSGFYAEPLNKTYIKVNSNDLIFPTGISGNGDVLGIVSQSGQEIQLGWITPSGGSPTNDPNSVQVNDGSGGFLGINNFTYDNGTNLLTISASNGIKVQPGNNFYQFGEFSNTGFNSSFIFDPSNRQLSYDMEAPVYSGVGFLGFGGQNNLTFDGSAYAVSDSTGSWVVTVDTPAGLVESGTFFVSSGLDDATFSGTYTGTGNGIFSVTIDGTGTPDTFSWAINGNVQTSNIPIVAGVPVLLQDGISVTFAASTGHNFNAQTVSGYGFGVVEYVASSFIGGDIAAGVTVTGSISGSTADVAYYSQGSGQVILTNLSAPFTTNDIISDGLGKSALLLSPFRYNATYDWTFNGGASHPNTPMIANNAPFALNTGMTISFGDVDSDQHEVGDEWNWSLSSVNGVKINSLNQEANNILSLGDTQQTFGVSGKYSYIDFDLKNANTSIFGKTVSISGGLVESTVDVVNYGTTTQLDSSYYDLQVGAGGSGATTVDLPGGTASPIGTVFIISDLGADCSSNNITIDAGGGNSIVGSSSAQNFVMSTDGQVVRLKKVTATQWKAE